MAAIVRFLVVLYLATRVPLLIEQVKRILQAMTNNPDVPKPNPSLQTVQDHLDELEAAQTAARSRAEGAVQARDVKKQVVIADVQQLGAYVQSMADADPARAYAIITGCAMGVRRFGKRQKQVFDAWCGDVSGDVDLCAPRVKGRVVYRWQWSADGVTWNPLRDTLVSITRVTGLAPKVTHFFRFRVLTKDGETEWSDPVSVHVL